MDNEARQAHVAGITYTFAELVPCAIPGGETAVLCTNEAGGLHYAPLSVWEAARCATPAAATPTPSVHLRSAPEAKIALYRSLFRGRDDAYAKGYRDRKADAKPNAIQYAPACLNEWTPPCRNLHHKCRICRHRENAPLTDDVIARHLTSTDPDFKGAAGLYVMQADETVFLLATDFDGDGWQRSVAAYRTACRDAGFDVAVERSRSGTGAHAWLFFDEAVEARAARALGTRLLTDAMARCDKVSFRSYDRMFPAQDSLVADGYGSLIALPLAGWARANGNAVFVDEKFAPYDDQWAYLSTVRRVEASAVAPYARATRTALGPLAALDAMAAPDDAPVPASADQPPITGGQPAAGKSPAADQPPTAGNPGEQLSLLDLGSDSPAPAHDGRSGRGGHAGTRKKPTLSPADFPAELRIEWRDTLRVPRAGLSPAAVNALRRLAAFANPEFYLAQSMRRSVRGIERVIYVGDETPQSIGLPRGCLDGLRDLLERSGVAYAIDDRRFDGAAIDVDFRGTLRPEQEPAVQGLLDHETGILSAPTGFGKTVVGAALIGALKVSTLVLVPRTALLNQWRDELERFLDIREEPPAALTKTGRASRKKRRAVGCMGGGRRELTGIIDVADYQSLFERAADGPDVPGTRRLREFVAQYGLVICDECHHGAAPLLGEALMHVPARRVYGLSATPRREDGLEGIVYLHCGPVRYVYGAKEQARAQGIARVMVPRFLGTRLDETVNANDAVQVQEALGADAARNAAIVDDTCRLVAQGRTPLVLTKLVEHARTLADQLERRGIEVHLLVGSDPTTVKRQKLAALRERAAATEEKSAQPTFAVVATGSYVGEGFDCAQLDALLLAAPVKSETLVTQFTGRLHRTGPGKTSVLVFDYVDAHIPLLDRMYRARLKTYARLAYQVGSPEGAGAGAAEKLGDTAPGSSRQDGSERDGSKRGNGGRDNAGHAAGTPSGGLVDGGTWIERLLADIDAAQASIAISATWANARTVQRAAEALARARGRGVTINVQLRLPGSDAKRAQLEKHRARLEAAGCTVVLTERIDGDFAILDKGLVWYGGISPLGSPKQNECSLRFHNPEVAHELAGAMEKCVIVVQIHAM